MATRPPPVDPARLVNELRGALIEVADEAKATPMAAYLKDRFPFLGVQAGARRQAQRPILAALAPPAANGDDLLAFARTCWAEPERELQYVATDALRKHVATLEARHLPDVKELLSTKSWWDTVDSLAVHTVGPLVAANPELSDEMDRWIDDPNIWVARTAILYQLSYKERTDADRLFAYVDARAADTEFFIRKALGWALRQYARTDPDAVRAFVADRGDRLSGLTRREALKRL
jgi:3-methyladenine DNA glycosylase AlkD